MTNTANTEYTAAKIAQICKGKLIQTGEPVVIKNILLDSRQLIFPAQTIFFALEGGHRSGMDYLKELHGKGVRNFIVSREPAELLLDSNIILVKNTTAALQSLSASHREEFKIPVIAITGSNGKTIVKEWLNQLLEKDHLIIRSPKSYNSQVGVPLSVWPMNANHTLAIFEAGISQSDEMQNLAKIIRPTIGIFTNIGKAHSEGFLNIRQKVNEKLNLFIHADTLIYRKEYQLITECLSAFTQQMKKADPEYTGVKTYTWTTDENTDADVIIHTIEKKGSFTHIEGKEKNKKISFNIPFIDDASVENAIHCRMLIKRLGYSDKKTEERLLALNPVAMRLEMKSAINHSLLINDSYNTDLDSLRIALDFLGQQKQHAKRTLILSDILQSGMPEKMLYEEIVNMLSEKPVQRMIAIGEALERQSTLFNSLSGTEISFYKNTDSFLQQFDSVSFNNETILLKGARSFAFERISNLLEQKAHETVLEINLDALVHNLNIYRAMLKPGTKIMAMVKAFGYGSGSFEIAGTLQHHRVNYLAVAYADEGVELRKAGITMPVMVMNPEAKSFDVILKHKLEPELYSLSQLKSFLSAVELFPSSGEKIKIHLELETGMHRLGFDENDLDELIAALKSNQKIQVSSVFSHLAASEEKANDDYTRLQTERFKKASEKIIAALGYPVLRHLVNTAGISRFPEAQFDMVRLGLGLYGIDATHSLQGILKNVSTLKTTVSQVKKIKAGESVGYNRMGTVTKDSVTATVGIGYADGYSRSLGNGKGFMLLKGMKAPVIGNVCMDMTMLDISGIPGVKEGDEVIVFGEELPVEKLAELSGTISYEIITGISQRVKRVYFKE